MKKASDILQELYEITPLAANRISPENPYQAPEGYFENLAGDILKRVQTAGISSVTEELEQLSPVLAKIPRVTPYAPPAGYFENLQSIPASKQTAASAKVVSGSFAKPIFRYFAAAALTGIIAVSAWLFFTQHNVKNDLAQTSDKEVIREVQGMSEAEMADYIDGNTTGLTFDNADTVKDIPEDDVKLMLADISDNELQEYVEQDADDAIKHSLN